MRTITKGAEPASLTEHRCAAHADYDNYADKDALRQALVSEQRGLCCYCLGRIRPSSIAMKIEHWHCQDHYPTEQLDYGNMLGACLGNPSASWQQQHCDTRKGNQNLSKNPADGSCRVDAFVRFLGDGTIESRGREFDCEINVVLNLNASFLKNNRKAVLDAFQATLQKRGTLERITIERLLDDWDGRSHANDLRPYCQAVVYWLQKRLMRH